jgi:hypothetical protein
MAGWDSPVLGDDNKGTECFALLCSALVNDSLIGRVPRVHDSSRAEESVSDQGRRGGVLEAAPEAGGRRRGVSVREPGEDARVVSPGTRQPQGRDYYHYRRPAVAGGARGGILLAQRRQPQQEPRLVDAEQLGVPQRAAAGRARPGAELRAAVPRRADRHHQRRLNPRTSSVRSIARDSTPLMCNPFERSSDSLFRSISVGVLCYLYASAYAWVPCTYQLWVTSERGACMYIHACKKYLCIFVSRALS